MPFGHQQPGQELRRRYRWPTLPSVAGRRRSWGPHPRCGRSAPMLRAQISQESQGIPNSTQSWFCADPSPTGCGCASFLGPAAVQASRLLPSVRSVTFDLQTLSKATRRGGARPGPSRRAARPPPRRPLLLQAQKLAAFLENRTSAGVSPNAAPSDDRPRSRSAKPFESKSSCGSRIGLRLHQHRDRAMVVAAPN